MSSQTSEAALRAFDQAEFVIVSTRTHKSFTSAKLNQLFREAPTVDGEGLVIPDWDQVQDCNADLLEGENAVLRRADQAHRVNLVKSSQLRRERRQRIDDLKTWHRDLRKTFEGTYGDKALPLVGLDAPPTTRFRAFQEQVVEVVERMRDPELASRLPPPRSGQKPVDLESVAQALADQIAELDKGMKAIKQMRKRLDKSLIAKREALKHHRRIYVNVAHVQEGYYRMVGLDALADRIRASIPRRSQPQPDDEPQPDDAPEKDSPSTSSEEETS